MVGAAVAAGGLVAFGAGSRGGGFGHLGGEAYLGECCDEGFDGGLAGVVGCFLLRCHIFYFCRFHIYPLDYLLPVSGSNI